MDESRRLVQADRRRQAAVRFQVQLFTADRLELLNRGDHQRTPNAGALLRGRDRHFGQFECAVALVLQSRGANDVVTELGEQDVATVIDDLALWVCQHRAIDILDPKVLFKPFLVQPKERIRIRRLKIDNLQIAHSDSALLPRGSPGLELVGSQ